MELVTEDLGKLNTSDTLGEEEIVEGYIDQEPENLKLGAEMPEQAAVPAPPVIYDRANTKDGDKAQDQARSIRLEFEPNDIKFWFSQLEGEMLLASVGSQWLKKTILQRNLPNKQKEDVKSYLMLDQEEAGDTIYKDIKDNLIRIYAPKPSVSYQKALQRTMTGLPSQLGYQIIDDICKKVKKLEGCCCAGAAQALWTLQIPVNVRAHVSNMEFTVATYKSVFEAGQGPPRRQAGHHRRRSSSHKHGRDTPSLLTPKSAAGGCSQVPKRGRQ